ncbi:hypothetical protein SBDP1_90068 [Syntrophobacter sp. SbD1]|nr:hypothetical protein SBDP1_90068 [Syntrophobacter sp. SbD1]
MRRWFSAEDEALVFKARCSKVKQ